LTYQKYTAGVWAVSWSPDSRYLASASKDQTVQVWEAMTGKLLTTYRGHTAEVWKVSWSPDGKHIASVGEGGVVQIWNAITGKQVWILHL
jgi:WD40 repeat protein